MVLGFVVICMREMFGIAMEGFIFLRICCLHIVSNKRKFSSIETQAHPAYVHNRYLNNNQVSLLPEDVFQLATSLQYLWVNCLL